MALSDLEAARIRRSLAAFLRARRPAPHLRSEVDLSYRVSGQSVEIFEIRQVWDGPPGEKMELPVAKATFVRTRGVWRIFWMRRDLKWHGYEPVPEVESVEAFCKVVSNDAYACFFG